MSQPDQRPHPAVAGQVDHPSPALDLHGYVLARLDEHLADLYRLRRQLVVARPTRPGARRLAAAATAAGAQRYARDIARALDVPHGAESTVPDVVPAREPATTGPARELVTMGPPPTSPSRPS
jgi:hypothetical protein